MIGNIFNRQKLLIEAYKTCFCDKAGNLTVHGEIVFKDLMDAGFLNKSVAMISKDGHIDTHATLMAEGKRELVLHIIEYVKADLRKILELEEKYND